jgi:hypothetical protein
MSSDAFDELERGLRTAVRRQAGLEEAVAAAAAPVIPLAPRRRRRFSGRGGALALVAALVVGGGAFAATRALDVGAPLPDELGGPAKPHVGAGVARGDQRILRLRVADPYGGPPWALRTFASSRGGSCVQVGQMLDGRFGRVRPGAGGRLQLRPISATPGQNSLCSYVSRNGYPVVRGLRAVEITGGSSDPRRCGGTSCPISAVRTIRYGLLGPAARSATYVDADGRDGASMAVDGAHGGAYLFVVRTDPAPYVRAEQWQRQLRERLRAEQRRLRREGLSRDEAFRRAGPLVFKLRPPGAGMSSRIRDGVRARFAGGTELRVAGRGRTGAALPGVTRRAAAAPATREALHVPLRVTRRGRGDRATYVVRFRAPLAIMRADHHYTLTASGRDGPSCRRRMPGGGFATTRDLARGAVVTFTVKPGYGGYGRRTWCAGRIRLRVGYSSGSGPFAGSYVGAYAFTVPTR